MRTGADRKGPAITVSGDERVTRVGRLLRKTKLDELPQLINVICGTMSLVGPRPEVPKYVVLYTAEQRAVLTLTPGITDEASIAFRNEEDLLAEASDPESCYVNYCIPRKIALNLDYAKRAGLVQDIGVICRTIRAICQK
jgi:lipopolysaccharide/colanic/teichoic acid biosynthesis glycosyltransferase